MSRLSKTVLIAGGAGDVGEAIVLRFLEAGSRVIVPSRSQPKLAHLSTVAAHVGSGELLTVVADINQESGMQSVLRAGIDRFGPLDGVVASLGSWYASGNLETFGLEEWNRIIEGGLTSHFSVARATIPLLKERPDSFYFLVNGGAALGPVSGSGPVSIVAAAQEMLKNVLVSENRHALTRVNSILVTSPIETRSREKNSYTKVSAADIGAYFVHLASAEGAIVRGKTFQLHSVSEIPQAARLPRIDYPRKAPQ